MVGGYWTNVVRMLLGVCWMYVGRILHVVGMLDLCWMYAGGMLDVDWMYVGRMMDVC